MDPSVTPTPTPSPAGADGAGRHTNTVVAFIIGFAIIMVASVLNAAGLNLTKLDHVSTVPCEELGFLSLIMVGENELHSKTRTKAGLATSIMAFGDDTLCVIPAHWQHSGTGLHESGWAILPHVCIHCTITDALHILVPLRICRPSWVCFTHL